MTELQLSFDFEQTQVRTMTDTTGTWFVGKDVATALGHQNPERAVRKFVDEDDRRVTELVTLEGNREVKREMTIINEPGVYALIFASQTEGARKFKKWVTHDVLPTIRKQGYYSLLSDEMLFELLVSKQVENPAFLQSIDKPTIRKKAFAINRERREKECNLLFINKESYSDRMAYRKKLRAICGDDLILFREEWDAYLEWEENRDAAKRMLQTMIRLSRTPRSER